MKKLLLLLGITTVVMCNAKAQSLETSTGYLWWIDQGISAPYKFCTTRFYLIFCYGKLLRQQMAIQTPLSNK